MRFFPAELVSTGTYVYIPHSHCNKKQSEFKLRIDLHGEKNAL